jgi:hypothetical protein
MSSYRPPEIALSTIWFLSYQNPVVKNKLKSGLKCDKYRLPLTNGFSIDKKLEKENGID